MIVGATVYVNPNGIDGYDNPLAGGVQMPMSANHTTIVSPVMDGSSIIFENGKPAYMLTGTIDNPVRNDQIQQQLDFIYGHEA
jgi:hypothetical protein